MGLTSQGYFDKLSAEEKKPLTDALEEVLKHGHGEINLKIQNGKIVFVQGLKNYKA